MSFAFSTPGSESSQQMTSPSLLLKAKTLDPDAWSQLVAIYTPLVRYWCQQAKLSTDDVHDVIQETFAAVLRGLPRFQHGAVGQSFRGWLRTIVRHRLIDWHRSRGAASAAGGTDAHLQLSQLPDPLAGEDSESPLETGMVFRAAVRVVEAEFETATANAFWLTTVEDRSPVEVAKELGITLNAVYKAKSRVLRRLREVLDGLE